MSSENKCKVSLSQKDRIMSDELTSTHPEEQACCM